MATLFNRFASRLPEHEGGSHRDVQAASLALADTPDGEPMLVLSYRCDFKAEEEWGAGELVKAFTAAADPVNFFRRQLELDNGGSPVSAVELHQSQLLVRTERLIGFATSPWYVNNPEAHERRLKSLQVLESGRGGLWEYERRYRWSKADELRALAKKRGVKAPSKLRKDELVTALARLDMPAAGEVTAAAGEFNDGRVLAFERGNGLFGEVLEALADAAEAGELGVTAGGVFGQGISFFDCRDLGPKLRAELAEKREFARRALAELEPVAELVKAGPMAVGGFTNTAYHFLGHPRFDSERGEVVYWLNGNSVRFGNGRSVQPRGWYTLAELRGGVYMERAAEEADEHFRRFDDRGMFRKEELTEAEAAAERERLGLVSAVEGLPAQLEAWRESRRA